MRRLFALLLATGVAGCAAPPTPVPTFPVFFTEWSSDLDDAAISAIAKAAYAAKGHPDDKVTVAGFASPVGNAQDSMDISRKREQVVTDRLVADGVAMSRIAHTARGATDFTLTAQESRRVDISVGGP